MEKLNWQELTGKIDKAVLESVTAVHVRHVSGNTSMRTYSRFELSNYDCSSIISHYALIK